MLLLMAFVIPVAGGHRRGQGRREVRRRARDAIERNTESTINVLKLRIFFCNAIQVRLVRENRENIWRKEKLCARWARHVQRKRLQKVLCTEKEKCDSQIEK